MMVGSRNKRDQGLEEQLQIAETLVSESIPVSDGRTQRNPGKTPSPLSGTMVFFDLNIPFFPKETNESSKPARKDARLKLVVKSMELGYTGIAYNRTIKGVMSDSDRCTIPLLPLSSLLKLAPTLSSAVRFHRELLGVPTNSPFRQYTRLTVAVDNTIHAAALNSGNPVLKTYDLIAVRPLNQTAFDHACKVSEVDLISIDFSQALPFRLKLPMVKAAIKRGVYFEITYSHLISDVRVRRQMLPGAKLLVDWTQGKNLIFSSAAPTANELRGPCDVANLSSLLGLSMQRAKASISKNCRSLITNALRRKHYYKEAIRVERISDGQQLNSEGGMFSDWQNWDPISSGEGDLSLDDIAKFFSATDKECKTSNTTDIPSGVRMPLDSTPSKDVNHWTSSNVGNSLSLDTTPFFFSAKENMLSTATDKIFGQSNGFDAALNVDDQVPQHEPDLVSPNYAARVIPEVRELEMNAVLIEHPSVSDKLDSVPDAVGMLLDGSPSRDCDVNAEVGTPSDGTPTKECISCGEVNLLSPEYTMNFDAAAKITDLPESCDGDVGRSNGCDVALAAHDMLVEEVLPVTKKQELDNVVSFASDRQMGLSLVTIKEQKVSDVVSAAVDMPFQDYFTQKGYQECRDDTALSGFGSALEETSGKMKELEKGDDVLLADDAKLGVATVLTGGKKQHAVDEQEKEFLLLEAQQKQHAVVEREKVALLLQARPGKDRFKRRRPFLLPFKGILKPLLFKKKGKRLKR